MPRIQMIEPEQAQGRTKELFGKVNQAFGIIPNATKVMANSPAVLTSFLALVNAMEDAKIGEKLHTQVKMGTSEANACEYCTSILCAIAPKAGLSDSEMLQARASNSTESRTDAALKFTQAVLEHHGRVSDEDLRRVRLAGYGDAEIVELVASVVVGCFTNFLNNVAQTALDIPKAEPLTHSRG